MSKLTLPLMGGLGNQLFQLQAALALFDGEIELLGNIGHPRTSQGIPDICHGNLPSRVSYKDVPNNKLMQKVHALVLRTFLTPSTAKYVRVLVKLFSTILFSIYLKRRIHIVASTDLGFSPLGIIKGNTLLIGYFQSHYWHCKDLEHIFSDSNLDSFKDFKTLTNTKSVCVLHIRRTDYLKEKSFGLLDSRYYEAALDKLSKHTNIEKIWLFSDDLDSAEEVMPEKYKKMVMVVDDSDLLPIEVLQLMSLGTSFVIANSTFSWWAAKLSKSKHVIAPEPWFISANEPSLLIPDEWQRLDRNSN